MHRVLDVVGGEATGEEDPPTDGPAVEALIASDFAPVQGFVLVMAVMYVLLNLMIDLLYGVIDPRVRMAA